MNRLKKKKSIKFENSQLIVSFFTGTPAYLDEKLEKIISLAILGYHKNSHSKAASTQT